MVGVELGNAQAAMGNISTRHSAYKSQLEGMLSDIESAPQEDVAMQIMALQTRLQASYQAASMISHLSLVNYLK